MSGIWGINFRDKADCLQAEPLLAMLRPVARASEQYVIKRDRPVGVGALSFPHRLAEVADLKIHGSHYLLAFHGSLYNREELLPHSSSAFSTTVIDRLLELYLTEGTEFIHKLRGEFALALWDGRASTLTLATDRFRAHPLFYAYDQQKFLFSSWVKGILACPFFIDRALNYEGIVDVAVSSIIPSPKTIFRQIHKLPPGHILTYRQGEVSLCPYWDITFNTNGEQGSASQLSDTLKRQLTEAVTVRLSGDENHDRLGTFLSGGVDSSMITGLLSRSLAHPVKSFSIGFTNEQFNEIGYARLAAKAFGAQHFEYFVTPSDVLKTIPVLLQFFDEPFANASAIPTYFCAQLAQNHGVEVLYAGDGGDELFAGNERYATQRLFDYYNQIPSWLANAIVKPVVFTLADIAKFNIFTKGKGYIQRAEVPYPQRLSAYNVFERIPMAALFTDGLLEIIGQSYDPYAPISQHYYLAKTEDELNRQLYIDLKLTIADNDLFKVTRMTEAARVAVRFPFLDHCLAEFAGTIPADIKMQGRQLRSFFKKTYADFLPPEVLSKKKHGFGLPIPVWLRDDKSLNELMHDLVLSSQSVQRGYFRKEALEMLVACHRVDKTSFYGTILWNLMILELWHRDLSRVSV